mmetsp:Transcript_21805/g.62089  ORF Transcript_21805/g.62089 Transcript_21805/m.62089 type:complete len:229 (+) Transcript_21805:363-1049(+)
MLFLYPIRTEYGGNGLFRITYGATMSSNSYMLTANMVLRRADWYLGCFIPAKAFQFFSIIFFTPAARTMPICGAMFPEWMLLGFPNATEPATHLGKLAPMPSSPRYLVMMLAPSECPTKKSGDPSSNRCASFITTHRRSPVYPALYPLGVVSIAPPVPLMLNPAATQPFSAHACIMLRMYPNLASLLMPCKMRTMGLRMGPFRISSICSWSERAFGEASLLNSQSMAT